MGRPKLGAQWAGYCSTAAKNGSVLTYLYAKDRLPFLPNLLRLGINVDSVMCPLCGEVPKFIDHIMVHCPKVKPIWLKCFSWWDLKPSHGDLSVKSFIDGIFCTHLPNIAQSVFVGVFYSALWAIWRWRNKVWHASDEDKAMELGFDTFSTIQSCSCCGSHIEILRLVLIGSLGWCARCGLS
ncbi:RNA-directed DNA polymerase, eukaryota, reverse transcriptase zinc-binding domain protein [Tanacetum coccineum]